MSRTDVQSRFDRVAEFVAKIVEHEGQDVDAGLDVRRVDLKLRAITVPGANPRYFALNLRHTLLTSQDSDEEIARQFVAAWRQQIRRDEP